MNRYTYRKKNTMKKEIREVIGELKELEDENRLYTPEKKVDRKLFEKGIVKAMCLHVSHDCNLACRYCFASGGNFNMKKEVMSFETSKKAIDFIINILEIKFILKLTSLEVNLF